MIFFWPCYLFKQSGVCGCEKGYTEVMTSHGFLDYCTRTPGVDHSKKADVKTNSGRLKPRPSQANDLFSEWTLQPVGPGTEMEIISTDQEAWLQLLPELPLKLSLHCSSRINGPKEIDHYDNVFTGLIIIGTGGKNTKLDHKAAKKIVTRSLN